MPDAGKRNLPESMVANVVSALESSTPQWLYSSCLKMSLARMSADMAVGQPE
jgi:hypothetical protein